MLKLDEPSQCDLLENAPCGYALLAMDGVVQWCNPAFSALSGLTSSGARFSDALTRAGAIFYETQLVPILMLREVVKEVALDLVQPPEGRVPIFLNANLRRDASGAPTGIRVALFGAIERRSYERELLESRRAAEQLADVVRRALDAIVTLSPDGYIQAWNLGAEQTFGYPAADVLGKCFVDLLFPAEARAAVTEAIRQLHLGRDVSLEICGCHSDRRLLDVSVRLTPHLEPPGVLVAFSAILRDVSSRRVAEQALIQSEKLASVGRLASSIAHEINNPLESVVNLLYILDSPMTPPQPRHYVRMAQDEIARVSEIVTHTLRFHRQSTDRTLVNITEALQSVLTLYRARLQHSGIQVSLQRKDAAPLLCFEGELRQILVNLMGNAFDAMKPSGGRLVLRNRNAAHPVTGQPGIRITVADTGPGIDANVRQRIFEPFVTTKGITGTGLGLWVTRNLVSKNAGNIRFRTSTRESGSGTVFFLWFPSTAAESAESDEA